ncbi:MAG: serine/threonine protein kinase [Kofleriaceae bacterium]|nr:serine/threonine protein kinase [Kofleriaceae bacterium]
MSELGEKYKLGERIGGGGMADVFRATTHGVEGFSRPVAIKQIKKSVSRDKTFGKLFIDEARIAAQLIHANIVQTIDFDRDSQGRFYLVMELIEGIDLRQLTQSGRIPVAVCVFIATEVLRGLDYAHELVDSGGKRATIVHRDISPHNIMLGWQGVVKVVDFGIAKVIERSLVSRSGSLKGKVSYMSPEQVHGHALDGRSDLSALGIVLHEILTGQKLFVGETEAATLSRLLTQPIPRPSALNDQVPPDLDNIVMRLLERDREHRYSRARDAMDALNDCSAAPRGRSQLETVLGERFADRIPKRVARLNSSSSSSGFSASYDLGDLASRTDSAADIVAAAVTLEATPSAKAARLNATAGNAASVGEAQFGSGARPIGSGARPVLEVKRTFTANPTGENTIIDEPEARPNRTRLILFSGLLIATAGALSAFFLSQSQNKVSERQPELVVVEQADARPGEAVPLTIEHDAAVPKSSLVARGVPGLDAGSVETADGDVTEADAGRIKTRDDKGSSETETEANPARLTIRVEPWATIEIDGKNYGQTPQTISLRHGKHNVVLRNSGLGKKESFPLRLKKGQRKSINKRWK